MDFKSPATGMFVQQLAQMNKNKKFYITGPLCGESTSDRWIPHTKDI